MAYSKPLPGITVEENLAKQRRIKEMAERLRKLIPSEPKKAPVEIRAAKKPAAPMQAKGN